MPTLAEAKVFAEVVQREVLIAGAEASLKSDLMRLSPSVGYGRYSSHAPLAQRGFSARRPLGRNH